ncbi:hypothetical protein SAMN05421507_1562 [Lentzea jiangxiensis]|uniref:Uncharacterized protein n=2 Tax=Lentzea jiangxiensis TaxID=641025 RepID=A0A1H0X8G5_9PSEU|nr:hypothetical protein SAMN05421507_1562 [Lentzea jiangxiensis]
MQGKFDGSVNPTLPDSGSYSNTEVFVTRLCYKAYQPEQKCSPWS